MYCGMQMLLVFVIAYSSPASQFANFDAIETGNPTPRVTLPSRVPQYWRSATSPTPVFSASKNHVVRILPNVSLVFDDLEVSLEVIDLNSDGYDDLVSSIDIVNAIDMMINDGLGNLGNPTSFSIDGSAVSLSSGFLNADGNLDVVTANGDSGTVSVLLGDGIGGFSSVSTFSAQISGSTVIRKPRGCAVGDVNNDGWADVVASDGEDAILVFLGNGTGNLGSPTEFSVGAGGIKTTAVAIGQFNFDSNLDVCVTAAAVDSVFVVLGIGNGTFGASTGHFTVNNPTSLQVSDLNGDGVSDVLVSSSYDEGSSGTTQYLQGQGNGTLFPRSGSGPSSSATFVDVNDDGNLDALTNSTGQYALSTIPGTGSSLDVSSRASTRSSLPQKRVGAGLFNADSREDIFALGFDADVNEVALVVSIYENQSEDSLLSFFWGTSMIGGILNSEPLSDDLDGDGNEDVILVASSTSGSGADIVVVSGLGDGTFSTPTRYVIGEIVGDVRLDDLNSDGLTDFVVVTLSDFQVWTQDTLGSFAEVFSLPLPATSTPPSLLVEDIGGSPDTDIIVWLGAPSFDVLTFFGIGNALFVPSGTVPLSWPNSYPHAIDLDGDGDSDLICSQFSAGLDSTNVLILENDGTGSFSLSGSPLPIMARGYVSVDLDMDTLPDLAICDELGNRVLLYRGIGTASFSFEDQVGIHYSSQGLMYCDVTEDGYEDLIVGAISGSTVSILPGQAGGGFDLDGVVGYGAGTSGIGNNYLSFALADVNNDGTLDLVGPGGPGLVAVSLNRVPNGSCCAGVTGDVNCDGSVGLPDLSTLIDHLFITFTELCCSDEADVNADGSVGLPDLSTLIDHLFVTFTLLPSCL